jgi:hypothetical protein
LLGCGLPGCWLVVVMGSFNQDEFALAVYQQCGFCWRCCCGLDISSYDSPLMIA